MPDETHPPARTVAQRPGQDLRGAVRDEFQRGYRSAPNLIGYAAWTNPNSA